MHESKDLTKGLSYREAGVDIEAGEALVARIKPAAIKTRRPGVLSGLGGFGALFELPLNRYRRPVLVSGADGVGTKLRLARQLNQHATIGIDLVAMCANDVLVSGAEPLFFLDYYAVGKLDVEVAAVVIEGIATGCCQAGVALVGGETAEMPGMYAQGDYDLAGFCVGIIERDEILDATRVRGGDSLLGLASSGPHANGYSLIHKLVANGNYALDQRIGDTTLAEALIAPTRIYVKTLLPLLRTARIHALAHITGGGITQNLPRVLPLGLEARIDPFSWPRLEIFTWLKQQGRISEREMLRTFNCGVGMVAVVPPENKEIVVDHCHNAGIETWTIGAVVESQGEPRVVYS